jgi:hypothetical protein
VEEDRRDDGRIGQNARIFISADHASRVPGGLQQRQHVIDASRTAQRILLGEAGTEAESAGGPTEMAAASGVWLLGRALGPTESAKGGRAQ